MLHITSLNEGLELFKALGSDVRIEILNILLENDNMSMNELAPFKYYKRCLNQPYQKT